MKTHFHHLIAFVFCLILANQAFAQTTPPRQPIREVTLTGTGYELGLQHGQIFKKEIGELVAKFKENTTKELGKDANEVVADFYQKTSFDASIKRWTPDLYEEVRGIADGSGQPFNDVMIFSLLDEFWVYQNNINNHHCSGVGVPARNGQPAYIAQNMDIEAYTDGYQVLLRIARNGDRPEQLILTHPGCIALNGMNETGIGACMNTLMQLNANTTGLPVAFIVRRILSSTDKDDLLDFIQNVPHASGQNYIIGIRDEVYDFEASANKVVRFDPKNENGTLYHTNHPLVNDDVKPWFKKYDPTLKAEEKPVTSNSFVRLAAVQRRVVPGGVITDATIKEALRSKDDEKNPVCRAPNQWGLTFGSVIMTLTGKPFLQITAGPPDESEYKRVEFSDVPFEHEPTSNYYTQGNANRTAAEWEPAKGTMVAWPLALPHKLVVELAKDNHLYTLVENDTIKAEAQKWYNQWGIEASHNTFVYLPRGIDFWWTRDWGPSAIFMPNGNMKLADANCLYVPPRAKSGCSDSLYSLFSDIQHETLKSEIDDNTIVPLGKGLNLEVLNLPFINTGGNFMTDGMGTAFSTCIMVSENKFHQVPEAQYFKLNQDLQGINSYHIISNFEKMGIQHIDCFMKLLDEERILVAEPPVNHERHAVYEKIIENELKKLKTVYGRPYEILRLKTDRYDGEKLAAYTNSIIVNKTIYVPLFQIKADSIALQTWRNAMPGYVVKGFEFAVKDEPFLSEGVKEQYSSGYGWKSGDALHCRTRAVWDNEMLYITVKRLPAKVAPNEPLTVYATMIDYSKKGLETDSPKLHWRIKGEQNWKEEPLKPADNNTHFNGTIPAKASGQVIEYYISAASKSGSRETMPRTAPGGFYSVERF